MYGYDMSKPGLYWSIGELRPCCICDWHGLLSSRNMQENCFPARVITWQPLTAAARSLCTYWIFLFPALSFLPSVMEIEILQTCRERESVSVRLYLHMSELDGLNNQSFSPCLTDICLTQRLSVSKLNCIKVNYTIPHCLSPLKPLNIKPGLF